MRKWFNIENEKDIVGRNRLLRWFGLVERKSEDDWVKHVEVEGKRPTGRQKKTWLELIKMDFRKLV
jgi:hypothetical protein